MFLKEYRLEPSSIFINQEEKNLRNTIVQGSFALVLSRGISIGISILNTLILARLLTPNDFGIIGMVTVFINFLVMFKDAGLSTATIQNERIDKYQISTLFWINALISLGLGIAILLSSPLIAVFYKKPEVSTVTAVLSISFIIEGFTIQHSALLQRHLKFRSLAINDIIAQICSLVTAITMASLGFNYWALIGATITRSIVLLILTYYCCPWLPGKFKKGTGVRKMLKFGGHITGSNFIGYLSRNIDNLLIGRFLGAAPLGLYSRAFSLLMQPLTQIRGPLATLSLPVMSSLRNDPIRYRNYFEKLMDVSISLALPVTVYCFIEGELLIHILLGDKWIDAAPVFKILSIAGIFISTSVAPGLVMLSFGFSKRYLHLNIFTAIITTVSLSIGVFYGITGVAIGYAVASFLKMIPLIKYGFKNTPIDLKLVIGSIMGPVFAASISGLISYLLLIIIRNDTILKHVIVGLSLLIVYAGLSLLRPHTRKTLKSIWQSIIIKAL